MRVGSATRKPGVWRGIGAEIASELEIILAGISYVIAFDSDGRLRRQRGTVWKCLEWWSSVMGLPKLLQFTELNGLNL